MEGALFFQLTSGRSLSSQIAALDSIAMLEGDDFSSSITTLASGTAVTSHGEPYEAQFNKRSMGGKTAAQFIADQPELVVNGGFDSDTNGWSEYSAGLSSVAGELRVEDVGSNAGWKQASQYITGLEIGKTYRIGLYHSSSTIHRLLLDTRTDKFSAPFDTHYEIFNAVSSGIYEAAFVASATTLRIGLEVDVTGVAFYDNISVKQLPPLI